VAWGCEWGDAIRFGRAGEGSASDEPDAARHFRLWQAGEGSASDEADAARHFRLWRAGEGSASDEPDEADLDRPATDVQ
jgi:hypothetical protein